MPSVSISKAAKLAGISRTHFYKSYISKGLISILRDDRGAPSIEISELLRVFPNLHLASNQSAGDDIAKCREYTSITGEEALLLEKIKGLTALLEAREQELEAYREREKQLYTLLGHDKAKRSRWWWPFGSV
jgi:hypothetical protein